MPVSHSDRYQLAQDAALRNRVRSALLIYCATVINENPAQVSLGKERHARAALVVNQPDTYSQAYMNAVACDAACISDATQAGTVALGAGNLAAQALLVTDGHIDAAIAAQFNYFVTPQ